ncbi:hypothetical protein TNCV_2160781 [Trichonephila clavipes]|nr:hypothetical protein TNCV_2160781 [Trichonephila clavipes]
MEVSGLTLFPPTLLGRQDGEGATSGGVRPQYYRANAQNWQVESLNNYERLLDLGVWTYSMQPPDNIREPRNPMYICTYICSLPSPTSSRDMTSTRELNPVKVWGVVAWPSRRERLGAERDRGRDQQGGAIGHGRMSGIVGDDLNKMVLTT